jgi:hypothetical protein
MTQRGGIGLMQTGPVRAPTPGRTDLYPKDAPDGSYVIPADIVSALGDGNSDAGHARLDQMFPTAPRSPKTGMMRHNKIPAPRASGGRVPIIVAGGEYVLSPDQVAAAGNGDIEAGKNALDDLVQWVRKEHQQTLATLPGPKGAR